MREGSIRSYPGNFADYVKSTDGHGFLPDGELMLTNGQSNGAASFAGDPKEKRIANYKKRKAAARKHKALEREVAALEREIEDLEQTIAEIHTRMAEPENATDAERLKDLTDEQARAKQSIEDATRNWERKSEELERLPKEM